MYQKIQEIIMEEFQSAERRILKRIYEEVEGVTQSVRSFTAEMQETQHQLENQTQSSAQETEVIERKLPENPKYKIALDLYRRGKAHSAVARELGVSISTAKNYYNTLVINKWLEAKKEELSEKEKEVVECIYGKRMSLNETAKFLGCTISNVTNRRNSALRKGYQIPEKF